MHIINANGFCSAKYDAQAGIVYYHYAGLIHSALGMETLRAVMDFATTHPIRGIVSDLSEMKGTFTSANDFLEKQYYPHMIAHGLICSAIVLSDDVFTKFAARDLLKKVGSFQLRMFDNFPEAERWVFGILQDSLTMLPR